MEKELTILMPCLNEAETIGRCVEKAKTGLARAGVSGEVLIADNGSTDGSQAIAEKLGARVVNVKVKGYGNALRGGVAAAAGKWIIMGDADDSYDFGEADRFVKKFQEGYELVMGCRLPAGGGTIKPGAMPWKNRWIGNPTLSFIGRLFFKCPAHDFHSGLRGFTKTGWEKMDLKTTGMEFASEMVISATLKGLKISEVPVTLYKDGRSRPPHLKPWRDGWRHLRFMLLYSPRWLFLVPGFILLALGGLASIALGLAQWHLGGVALDVGTQAHGQHDHGHRFSTGFLCVFHQGICHRRRVLLPPDEKFADKFRIFTLEKGLVLGLGIAAIGASLLVNEVWVWHRAGYGQLSYSENLRQLITATTLLILGIQIIFSSFFMSVLGLKTVTRKPPELAAHPENIKLA